jgi:hypothetical protein
MEDIYNDFKKWIGILICGLSVIGFFISSDNISDFFWETLSINQTQGDSNASEFLVVIILFLVSVLVWLKKLPIAAKIIGFIVGGIIWLIYADD